ncbi:MAG: ATP-binding protein [Phycisphaerales bacterium]
MSAIALSSIADQGARSRGIGAEELAELLRAFTDVTERLQTTHSALEGQVSQLKSELAEANEQLRRSRELAALGEMAAGIAHEIRNPLGSIALDVEILREDCAGRADQRVLCDRVLRSVERLDQIVGDVLRFARDLRLNSSETEPAEIVDAALDACEAILRRGGVIVERVVCDGEVSLDRHLFAQALTNLVRNAAEAMLSAQGERTLRIEARRVRRALGDGRRAEHLVIRVEDTGPGVPDDMIERIFHPFFTTRAEGTGLGLAIVHRIVDAHGGSITVRNTGGGARFEIAIPVRPEDRRRGARHGLEEAVSRRIGPLAG